MWLLAVSSTTKHVHLTLLLLHLSCLGVKMTLSALIDGKNFNTGGHKVGLGFELEA